MDSVITNDFYSFSMPSNGVCHSNWWLRGAYEDAFRLDLGGMPFPLGTNLCSSLWVHSWGMAGVRLGDVSNRVAATGVPMSAVPGLSRFWSAETDGGGRLLTWQGFFLGRDTNAPVSAQLELMPSGDFIARSNLVERAYRRVNPDDWDDDGIPNERDIDPLVPDGDGFGPHQQLPEGANTNHYYWVDVVVDRVNARVAFEGDGYSHLPDPVFIARAGETNRVMLLIGKAYTMRCMMPVQVVGKEDVEIEVSSGGEVVWPVSLEFVPLARTRPAGLRSHGTSGGTTIAVHPERAGGGGFGWPDNFCCHRLADDGTPVFDCDGTCGCAGCATGDITYGIGGHELAFGGFRCPCDGGSGDGPEPGGGGYGEDDGPYDGGASATFSKGAVIFEDRYENTPGAWVERLSSRTELECVAHGGPNGGRVRFEISSGAGKVERVSGRVLPVEQDVGPGMRLDFTTVYEGRLPSASANDIVVTTTFTENAEGAEPISSQARLTSVKVTLESTNYSLDDCPNRHIRGIGESVSCKWAPSVSGLSFQTRSGAVCTESYGNSRNVTCPFHAALGICEISVGGATHTPDIEVLEPTGIEARNPRMLSFSIPQNSPGGAGFCMNLHIMPDTVSFQALDFWERPAYDSTIEGYFTNAAFQLVWYHDTNMGAGVWQRIGDANFWFTDAAQMGDELITPVCPGRLVWHIPVDWRKRDDSTLTHQDFKSVDQTFEMSATGRLTVYKYQHWAAREMSGETFKSEGMTE